jgi:hypothetical protein
MVIGPQPMGSENSETCEVGHSSVLSFSTYQSKVYISLLLIFFLYFYEVETKWNIFLHRRFSLSLLPLALGFHGCAAATYHCCSLPLPPYATSQRC